ncbi:MAG: hypothetical protein EB127_16895, partial [Alphaproteobacteria bacterium]|nr:hypothetical protein [Alphaproteobacteria bacterium]
MAVTKSLVQTVEFVELRRVFKKESDDIEKIDKDILSVLKDNNALLRDLVDKLDVNKVSSGLGLTGNKGVDRGDNSDDQPYTVGTFKDFTEGFSQRLKEYKDFFTNAKKEEVIPDEKIDDSATETDISATESATATTDLNTVELQKHTDIFQDILGEIVLLRKLNEGSIEFDKSLAGGKYRNTSGGEVTNLSTGNVSKQGGTLDFETVRAIKKPKRLLESASSKPIPPSLMLPAPAAITSAVGQSSNQLLPTKLIDDIGNIRKAMLGDGINVKIINPEEVKSEGGDGGGGGVGEGAVAVTPDDLALLEVHAEELVLVMAEVGTALGDGGGPDDGRAG